MLESSKTKGVRGANFAETYFSGSVLDIGCGEDLVVPHATPFDQIHGDANHILKYLEHESFDTVHSSHCLEHMIDPIKALQDWWQLVKPGGYMITVVPHEDLYEQGQWPSRFNDDHKATFRFKTPKSSWSPCSYDAFKIHYQLDNSKIISADLHDLNYKYELQKLGQESETQQLLRNHLAKLFMRLNENGMLSSLGLLDELNFTFSQMGAVVDQTMGSAMAQVQIIAQKRS